MFHHPHQAAVEPVLSYWHRVVGQVCFVGCHSLKAYREQYYRNGYYFFLVTFFGTRGR
jgi:hypothetical protein